MGRCVGDGRSGDTELAEEALRSSLDQETGRSRTFEPLPTFSPPEPGLRPGVDLEDRHAVMDLLDGIDPRR